MSYQTLTNLSTPGYGLGSLATVFTLYLAPPFFIVGLYILKKTYKSIDVGRYLILLYVITLFFILIPYLLGGVFLIYDTIFTVK